MFRTSLNLFRNIKPANLWQAPAFRYISIRQPTPFIEPTDLHKEVNNTIKINQDDINKYWIDNRQEIIVDGQTTVPIFECKHKPKELAKRKRRRRRYGAKTNARFR